MTTALDLGRQWTWLCTKPSGAGVTLLSNLVSDAEIAYVLNAPAQATGELPADTPQVNIPYTDGDPFVSFNNRLLYGLRREGDPQHLGFAPYVCRFAGVMMILEDEALSDEPVTHFTAYDPWMWLNTIPVFTAGGDLLGKNGLSYSNTPGSTIARALLTNALAVVVAQNPANPLYIDDATGHFDTTDAIDIDFQQGTSVGEAWTQLVDTGSLDIVLDPIYEPSTSPGKLARLSIYQTAGSVKNAAIFSWDKMPRSLSGIDRLTDGTQMINVAQFYANGLSATQQTDASSVAAFGQYWAQQNYPAPSAKSAVSLLAAAKVALRRRGKMTLTVQPDPDRSPDPFTEYYLGDRVPVWAGRAQAGGGSSFRAPLTPGDETAGAWTNPQRVFGFNVTLQNDQSETVTDLLLTDSNS